MSNLSLASHENWFFSLILSQIHWFEKRHVTAAAYDVDEGERQNWISHEFPFSSQADCSNGIYQDCADNSRLKTSHVSVKKFSNISIENFHRQNPISSGESKTWHDFLIKLQCTYISNIKLTRVSAELCCLYEQFEKSGGTVSLMKIPFNTP